MTRTSGSFSLSTRAPATPTLIGLQLAVFVGIASEAPGPDGAATIERLVAWGANFGPLTLSGEWWRLLSCAFVHESFPHIASNLVGLWIAGSLLERRFQIRFDGIDVGIEIPYFDIGGIVQFASIEFVCVLQQCVISALFYRRDDLTHSVHDFGTFVIIPCQQCLEFFIEPRTSGIQP